MKECAQEHPSALSFHQLLEMIAEKVAAKLVAEPLRLQPRLMTISQAAVYTGQSAECLQQLLTSGAIPILCTGKQVLVDRQDLDGWIEQHKYKAGRGRKA